MGNRKLPEKDYLYSLAPLTEGVYYFFIIFVSLCALV